MLYLKNKTDVVQFVEEELKNLKPDSALTMTIGLDTLGAYSVNSVIGISSEDIVKMLGQFYYEKLTSIS